MNVSGTGYNGELKESNRILANAQSSGSCGRRFPKNEISSSTELLSVEAFFSVCVGLVVRALQIELSIGRIFVCVGRLVRASKFEPSFG
jgi:hypothetical protein